MNENKAQIIINSLKWFIERCVKQSGVQFINLGDYTIAERYGSLMAPSDAIRLIPDNIGDILSMELDGTPVYEQFATDYEDDDRNKDGYGFCATFVWDDDDVVRLSVHIRTYGLDGWEDDIPKSMKDVVLAEVNRFLNDAKSVVELRDVTILGDADNE